MTPEEFAESAMLDFGELFAGMDPACKASCLASVAEAIRAAVTEERNACAAAASKRGQEYIDANDGLGDSSYREMNEAAADACHEVAAEINARSNEGVTP